MKCQDIEMGDFCNSNYDQCRKFGSDDECPAFQIYISDEGQKVPIEQALEIMTDEWILDGNECAQTVIDMRDVLKNFIQRKR